MSSRLSAVHRFVAAATVGLTLLVLAPLFARSPLGPDPVMYDLQTQLVQDGGVLYRDVLEPNLPGAVWMHLAIRSVGGWSSEALRLADLLWFLVTAVLAARLMRVALPTASLVIALLVAGYCSQSEWCHCQRDEWMLPFVLGAVLLRIHRLEGAARFSWVNAVLEGALWGAAVWLKPHVVLPAASAVGVSFLWNGRAFGLLSNRQLIVREAAVIAGGLLVGVAGVAWLVRQGAWEAFWSTLTEWNGEYVAASSQRWSWGRLWSIQERLAPWSLIHLCALPAACWTLWRLARDRDEPIPLTRVLASAVYLGWLVQVFCFQHLFDYVHVPPLVLGAIVAGTLGIRGPGVEWRPQRLILAGTCCVAVAVAVAGRNLAVWPECVRGPASAELRDRLARLPLPVWTRLSEVGEFLRSRGVSDGELTAYHTHTIHLFPLLGVRPSTRYVFTETHLRLFPGRAGEIADGLQQSPQRYVVSDLLEAGLDPEAALDDSSPDNWRRACPAEGLGAFPFDQPVVFRAGPYLVHEVQKPIGPVETGFFPLAARSAGL